MSNKKGIDIFKPVKRRYNESLGSFFLRERNFKTDKLAYIERMQGKQQQQEKLETNYQKALNQKMDLQAQIVTLNRQINTLERLTDQAYEDGNDRGLTIIRTESYSKEISLEKLGDYYY